MRKLVLGLAAVTMTVPAVSTPAMAQYYGGSRYSSNHYDRYGNYDGPVWRGRDGRLYCRRSNGTTGLIVGAGAGALIGRAIDNRGSRATGTILGAAVGALIGREVQRSRSRNRCR